MNPEPRDHLQRVKGAAERRGGFTLVELLVVVSIIALLIAILLPSLRRAREQAKEVMCLANLRSMGQAFTMYAEKFGGVWPPATDQYNTNRWPVPFYRGGILTAELATFDANGNMIHPPNDSLFICPSEKAPRIIPDWNPASGQPHKVDRVEVGGSYGLNEEIHRTQGRLQRGDAVNKDPFLRKIDSCPRASEIYAVAENNMPLKNTGSPGWRFNRGANETPPGTFATQGGAFWTGYRFYDGSPVPNDIQYVTNRIIGGHHMGRGCALCVDTHAETYIPDKMRYNQVSWERWPNPDEKPPGGQ